MLTASSPLPSQDINKRLSLPADLRVPDAFLQKQSISPEVPLSRASRRQSLSEIGFGRMETYTKLDKLGEVRKYSLWNTRNERMRQVRCVFWGSNPGHSPRGDVASTWANSSQMAFSDRRSPLGGWSPFVHKFP